MTTFSSICECLNCEKHFDPFESLKLGTPLDFEQQYCSPECYNAFEQILAAEAAKSTSLNLVDSDNNPLLSSAPSKESTAQQLLQHFHLKVNTKPKE